MVMDDGARAGLAQHTRFSTQEVAWFSIVGTMNGLYALGAFVTDGHPFGIGAVHAMSASTYMLVLPVGTLAAFLLGRKSEGLGLHRSVIALGVALASAPLFFLGRSNFLNPDGRAFAAKFARDVPQMDAHITHDEMLELFVHSRFWYYMDLWWGWTVALSYQVLSCVAGALFVYAIIRLARRLTPSPFLFIAGILSGGYMQLFFGDVENYSIMSAIVVLYVLAACRYLAGEVGIWVPAVVLATAACFHLEAAVLGPSLLYLFWIAYVRTGSIRAPIIAGMAAAGIVGATAGYFHFHGLPLGRFLSSHAGSAMQSSSMLALHVPWSYWFNQLNLVVLLCPAALMVVPLLSSRIKWDATGLFLAVAAGCMVIFQVAWRAQLGVYNDWNLYAMGGVVISLFLWRTIATAASTSRLRTAAFGMAATGWLHSYAWIAANHGAR